MFQRITSNRIARVLLWILVTLATLIILLYVWTNWSGNRRWAATKAEIEREGETLDFRRLLPETPPESANLLAIEPLRDLVVVVDNDDKKGKPGAKRQAIEAMKWNAGSAKAPGYQGVMLGEAMDLQGWAAFLRESKFLDLPEGTASGKEILAALDSKCPLLKQLADEAPKRPRAMFTPGLRERELPEMLFALRVPYYNSAQTLVRLLSLRAMAAVDARNVGEALRSILAASGISQACKQEPLLIGFLVGIAADAMTTDVLWWGLRERVFAEEELRQLQDAVNADETDRALLQAFRGEMACSLNAVEWLQDAAAGRKNSERATDLLMGMGGHGLGFGGFRLLPEGLFNHWKSVMGELNLRHLVLPLKGGMSASLRAADALDGQIKEKHNALLHPDWIMARLTFPALMTINASALHAMGRNREARAALALERFQVKHGRYPERLEELVPEFMPAVPLDPCDDKPLRYRQTAAGRYRLWSVGFDGKDDDGKVTTDKKESVRLNKRGYVGDWTWQYEPAQ